MTRMKDSGIEWIGEVPEEWGLKPIKYLVSTPVTDGPHETPTLYDEGIPFLSAESVKNGILDSRYKRGYISETAHKIFSRKVSPQKNDIFIVKSGATTGNVGIVTTDEIFDIWSPLALVRTRSDLANQKFVYYFMLSDAFTKQIQNKWSFGTQQNIGMGVIEKIKLVVPPLDEQTQIANFLDKKVAQLDSVKSLLEEQVKTLEDYRQSLIYETVTKGLDKTVPLKDSGVDWIGQIPEGWGVKPIKYCSRFQRGFGFPVELQGNDDGEIPFYKVSDLRGNSDEISISKNYVDLQTAKQNAWVIVPSGAIIAPVIGAALLNNNRKISTVPFISDNNTLAIIPNNKNKYFYYLFKVIDMNWFNNSSTIPAVNISKLANQIVPTPKEEEQKQIADFLEVQIIKIDKLIEIKQKQINNINQQRQTLIYDVVTGKRRV